MGINFLSSFFSRNKKKPSGEEIKIHLSELPKFIENEFLSEKKMLLDFCAKKISEIRYAHNKSVSIVERISKKELESKQNERMNRVAITSKNQLVVQLTRLLEKINPNSAGSSIDEIRKYSGESYFLLSEEIITFRKNIAYTSLYLKEDMKLLGETLQELMNALHSMNTEFENHKNFFHFEKTLRLIEKTLLDKANINLLDAQIKSLSAIANKKLDEIKKQNQEMEELRSGTEMTLLKSKEDQINKLMEKKQELRTQISALILSIDRPLQRFKQLVDSNRWKLSANEKEMLELFITNPIQALRKDPKADLFKKILGDIVKAIMEGKIELKEREKEKRLEALQEIINFDFFGEVFWKMNELQKKQNELNNYLSNNKVKNEIEKIENQISYLKKELADINQEIEFTKQKKETIEKEVFESIQKIVNFIQESLGKKISIE